MKTRILLITCLALMACNKHGGNNPPLGASNQAIGIPTCSGAGKIPVNMSGYTALNPSFETVPGFDAQCSVITTYVSVNQNGPWTAVTSTVTNGNTFKFSGPVMGYYWLLQGYTE